MVAAPTQPAEWVALYTYPSSAALYSQLPISEAALAPISARAAGIARTSRYVRAVVSPIAGGDSPGPVAVTTKARPCGFTQPRLAARSISGWQRGQSAMLRAS